MKANAVAAAILLSVALMALILQAPVRSIVPYALTVGIVAFRSGAMLGLVTALMATIVATSTGAFPTAEQWRGQEWGEALATLLKLASIAAGVVLGKHLYARDPTSIRRGPVS